MAGALLLPGLRAKVKADRTVILGTLGTAVVLITLALVPGHIPAMLAGLVAGASWIAVLSTVNVAAQAALPDWVRTRGLAIYLTVFSGAMSVGSLRWGAVATHAPITTALLAAAAGVLLAIPLTLWARLSTAREDLTTAHHWPSPAAAAHDAPTTIWIAHDLAEEHRDRFILPMQQQRASYRAHGAYGWVLRHDTKTPTRRYENWHEASCCRIFDTMTASA